MQLPLPAGSEWKAQELRRRALDWQTRFVSLGHDNVIEDFAEGRRDWKLASRLMPLQIFRSGALRRANIGAVTLFGSYVSFQFLATQYLQSLAGWSPISTALAFLPVMLTCST